MLLIAELIAPGFFLMFIGAAAIATGLLSLLLPVGIPLQLAMFAIVALVIVRVGGRRAYASKYDHSTDPLLNDRAGRLVGHCRDRGPAGRRATADAFGSATANGRPAADPPQPANACASSTSTAIA